jgi:hypothetical protein
MTSSPNFDSKYIDCNSVSYSFGAKIQGIIPVLVEPQFDFGVLSVDNKPVQNVQK